ncbi:hypothetical protein FQN54_004167 [Arachnomyces sp. PD_36]|nr:hypothetical protein FQN54_004167 [Arachnomyces sp. PD_36]
MPSDAFINVKWPNRFNPYEETPMRGGGPRKYARILFEEKEGIRPLLRASGSKEIKDIDDERCRHLSTEEHCQPDGIDAVVSSFGELSLCERCADIPVVALIRSQRITGEPDGGESSEKDGPVSACQLCDILHGEPGRRLTILPEINSWIYFELLSWWLDKCHEDHRDRHLMPSKSRGPARLSRSRGTTARMPPAPARLIYVGERGQERLVEGESSDKIYIALSHRWGPKTWLARTTLGNVEERKLRINPDTFPQTFQDAIATTRRLGLQYLWIDSLCIVQDNDDELAMECSRMELIFSQAYSVIAATSPYSTYNGFLSRHGMEGKPLTLPNGQEVPYLRVQATDPNFRRDVLQESMHTRGWVFQERALARHTIHFATSQAYWECEDSVIGESGTDETFKGDLFSSSDFPRDRDLGCESVKAAFRQYSNLDLSFPADRPRAVMALEYRIALRNKCVSLYGILGADHLHTTLVWKRRSTAMSQRIDFRRTNEVVPSWSWMSRMGAIDYLEVSQGLKRADVEFLWEALDEGAGADDTPKHYQLRGKLYTVEDELSLQTADTSGSWTIVFLGNNFTGNVSFDEDRGGSIPYPKFLECVVIWSDHRDDDSEVDARQLSIVLLVERAEDLVSGGENSGEGCYRRIGIGVLDGRSFKMKEGGYIRII